MGEYYSYVPFQLRSYDLSFPFLASRRWDSHLLCNWEYCSWMVMIFILSPVSIR